MLSLLRQRATVEVFDRAHKVNGRARKLWRALRQLRGYWRTMRRSRGLVVYMALTGGLWQLVDGVYILIARIHRRPIFIHHHSFAYINQSTLVSRLLFASLRHATHIVLSDGMGRALAQRYAIEPTRVVTLSNAAFFDAPPGVAHTQAPAAPIRLGFLGNITYAKGIVEFFEVLNALQRLAVPYRAHIAGPVIQDASETFQRLLSGAAHVEHVGPLYGEAKSDFYQRLDILLFPTKYINEAEPLVIHEAIRSGVHVIACARGAISEVLSNGAGLVFDQEVFVAEAVAAIRALEADRAALAGAKRLSFEQARRLHITAEGDLTAILARITGEQ